MLALDDLHDAILESVSINVDAGTIVLSLTPVQFEGAPERVTLIAREWKAFSCPKQEPWGHSARWFVNEARGSSKVESGLQHLELEMQSGDVVEIDCASLERIDGRYEVQAAG